MSTATSTKNRQQRIARAMQQRRRTGEKIAWFEYRSSQRHLGALLNSLGGKRRFGLRVIAESGMCYTDFTNREVVIDPFYLSRPTDPAEQLVMMKGYIAHEAAHIRFTTPAYGMDVADTSNKAILVARICNMLEDERIERAMANSHWGSEKYLRVIKRAAYAGAEAIDPASDKPEEVLTAMMHMRFGRVLKGQLSATNQALFDKCWPFVVKAWNGRDSNVVRACAEEIIKILGLENPTDEQVGKVPQQACRRSMSGQRPDAADGNPNAGQGGDTCPTCGKPGAGDSGQQQGQGQQPGQGQGDESGEGQGAGAGEGQGDESGQGAGQGEGAGEGQGQGQGAGEGQGQGAGAGQGQGSGEGQGQGAGAGQGQGSGEGQGQGQGAGAGQGQGSGEGQGQGEGAGQGTCPTCGQPNDGEGEGTGEGQGAGSGQSKGKSKSKRSKSAGGGQPGAQQPQPDPVSNEEIAAQAGSEPMSDEELRSILEEAAREIKRQYGFGAGNTQSDKCPLQPVPVPDEAYNAAVARSQVLRRLLERTPPLPRSRASEDGPRYSFRDELRNSDRPMRRREVPTRKRTAAIGVLVDCSGSMGSAMISVVESVLATYIAADAVGVPFAVWGFSDWHNPPSAEVVPFGMSPSLAPEAIAGLDATGGTVLAPALRDAATKIMAQRADRHVLLVIHDGQPSDVAASREAVAAAKRKGAEVVGIFLGDDTYYGQMVEQMRDMFGQRLITAEDADTLMPLLGTFLVRLLQPPRV